MRLASLLLPSLLASACGPGEPLSDSSFQESPSEATAALTLTRTYDCFRFVNTGMTSFSIQHLVNVMSDGSVISTCHLDGALQGSSSSVFQGAHPEAEKGQCTVHASANGTATGESWTLNLHPSILYSGGIYHQQNSPQDGLVYALTCSVR